MISEPGPDDREYDRVELLVRAASTASVSEHEFVQRLRGHHVTTWPRTGTGQEICGYALQIGGSAERVYTDADLPPDLALRGLRRCWELSERSRREADEEWLGLRAASVFDRAQLVLSDPVMWSRMGVDAAHFHSCLLTVAPGDTAVWNWAATRLAGAFAAWSLRTGADTDSSHRFAVAAKELGRSAAVSARRVGSAPTRGLGRVAFGLAAYDANASIPVPHSLFLLIQLLAATLLVAKAHRGREEPHRWQALTEVSGPLAAICN
jgi:hypothetical protein